MQGVLWFWVLRIFFQLFSSPSISMASFVSGISFLVFFSATSLHFLKLDRKVKKLGEKKKHSTFPKQELSLEQLVPPTPS